MNNKHQIYGPNTNGRDFVVGDLHGMYNMFMEALDNVSFNYKKDRCFSVGDLIDRGPDSEECLYLQGLPWFHSVRGNHEEFLIDYMKTGRGLNLWMGNGGAWSRECDDMNKMYELATSMPYTITIRHKSGNTIGISHAQPVVSDWDDRENMDEKDEIEMVWGRKLPQMAAYGKHITPIKNVSLTIHGHTILDDVALYGNSLYIDLGAFCAQECWPSHTGKLMLVCLDEYLETL